MARTLVPRVETCSESTASPPARRFPGASLQTRQNLVQENLGFVIKVAREYRNLGLPVEDLISEGSLGLMEAARRYDPLRGAKFVTYAAAWVRKAILRALSQCTRTIRIPSYHLNLIKRYQRTEALLTAQLGRRPDRHEVSQRLRSSDARVEALLTSRITEVSLEATESRGPFESPIVRVQDPRASNPEIELLRGENQHLVEEALSSLDARERLVIIARFGLEDGFRATLRELGVALHLSRERVRQIEERAKMKIRRRLQKKLLYRRAGGAIMRLKASSARRSASPRLERGGGDTPG